MKAIPALALAGRAVLLFLLALAAGIPPARAADANPPDRLTYQGFLVDANGVALGNTAPKNYDVIFRIYDSSSGGTRKWTEQQTLTVDKGYFSVLLGEGAAVSSESHLSLSTLFADATASDRYVEITVKGIGAGGTDSTIAPRLRLLTAPYAFLAKSASQLVNAAGSNYVSVSGTTVSVSGTLSAGSFSGNGASLTSLDGSQIASGTVSSSRIASLDASKVTSGTFSTSRIPSLSGSIITSGTIGSSYIPSLDASKITGGMFSPSRIPTLTTSHIPSLDASKITSGSLDIARIPSTVVRTDTLSSVDPSGTTKLRIGTPSAAGAKRITFGDGTDYVFIGESGIDDHLELKGNRGIEMYATGPGYNAEIALHTENGKTVAVKGNYLEVLHATDKSMYVRMFREANHFGFNVGGGGLLSGNNTTVYYNGDSNWDFTSDRRLKTNIVDAESVLERVMAVKMRRFRWIGGNPEAAPELGVIAQEFQPLFPELVSKTTPPTPNPACPDGMMTVGLTSLGTIAIKAIQELKQEKDGEIAGLRQENTLLKEKIEQLSRQAAHVAQLEQEMATLKKLVARAVELRRDERPVAGIPVTSSSGTGGNQ